MRSELVKKKQIDLCSTFERLLYLAKEEFGNDNAFRFKTRKTETVSTFSELYKDVAKITRFFCNNYGSEKKIGLIGENSYIWIITYFGIVCSNNIVVPLDKDLPPSDVKNLMMSCDSEVLVYSADYADIAESLNDLIGNIDLINMTSIEKALTEINCDVIPKSDPNNVATIVYTSGTTGQSKGVMLSQKNLCTSAKSACMSVHLYGRTLALLPFHHTYAFTGSVLSAIYCGVDSMICHSLKNVTKLIKDFKPTYLVVVPIFVEKMDAEIVKGIKASGKQNLIRFMDRVCKLFDTFGAQFRKKCFSKIRNELGGSLDFIIVGGAALNQEAIDRFDSYGIQVLNGYGISECSPFVSINRRNKIRAMSIGQVLPGVKVRIDSPNESGEGEICVKGDNVMLGYYNLPEESALSLQDGWFYTGDIGKIDKDGFIYITGRIKNLIIMSNGKNVAPEELEMIIAKIPGVKEVLVYAYNQQLVAEIYPDKDYEDIETNIDYFEKAVFGLNDELPSYKMISKVVLREEEFEKTTTKKIKRNWNA